jgi:hypothetical protein
MTGDIAIETASENTVTVPPPISSWLKSLQVMPPRDIQNPPEEWARVRELDIKKLSSFSKLTPEEEQQYEEFSDRITNLRLQESLPVILKVVLSPGFSAHAPAELGDVFQEGKSDIELTNELQAAVRQGNQFALYLAAVIYDSQLRSEMVEADRLRKQGHETGNLVEKTSGIDRYYKAFGELSIAEMATDALSKKFGVQKLTFKDNFPTASAVFASTYRVALQPSASSSS